MTFRLIYGCEARRDRYYGVRRVWNPFICHGAMVTELRGRGSLGSLGSSNPAIQQIVKSEMSD